MSQCEKHGKGYSLHIIGRVLQFELHLSHFHMFTTLLNFMTYVVMLFVQVRGHISWLHILKGKCQTTAKTFLKELTVDAFVLCDQRNSQRVVC